MPDAHHEGVAAGARLGQDLDLLAAYETELEQPPLERGEDTRACADRHDPAGGTGRERGEAHETGVKREPGGSGDGVHGP